MISKEGFFMKYAVIVLNGKQHVVTPGEKVTVDRLPQEAGATLEIKDVLLTVDGENSVIGLPYVPKALVKAKVVSHGQGEKIRVAKFKAKARYRRVTGHRQSQTTIEILSI